MRNKTTAYELVIVIGIIGAIAWGAGSWISGITNDFHRQACGLLGMPAADADFKLGTTSIKYSHRAFVSFVVRGSGCDPKPPVLACDQVFWYSHGLAVVALYVKDGKVIHVHCGRT